MNLLLIFCAILMTSLIYTSSYLKGNGRVAQAVNKFGKSKFIVLYSKYIQTKVDKFGSYGNEPASQKYQDLGAEAQQALDIAPELQLPVKKIKSSKIIKAVVGSDGIYVNEDVFEKMPFGAQRSSMFHESVHAKYHDAAALGLLKIVGLSAGCLGMYELFELCDISTLQKSASVVAGIVSSLGISFKYRQFMERRADTQGHQATGCQLCVQEEIDSRTNMFKSAQEKVFEPMDEERKIKTQAAMAKRYKDQDPTDIFEKMECIQGYLRRSELHQIKQNFKDGQLCAHHGLKDKQK